MYTFTELQKKLKKTFEQLKLPARPRHLYEPVHYMVGLGGKRLRPTLLLMACDLFEGEIEKALAPAVGIELFHNFTLIHDDIMDQAPIRRGQPTVHKKYGEHTAILAGDVMFVLAYDYLAKTENGMVGQALEHFNETARKVCEGQQLDLDFEQSAHIQIEDYLEMIGLKTATLIAGSLAIGAVIAGAKEEAVRSIYRFGKHCGIAFQLQDDILDTFGDEHHTGKQVGGDILMNKKTYLLLKAYENADRQEAKELEGVMTKNQGDPSEKVTQVRHIFESLGVKQQAEATKSDYLNTAFKALEKIQLPADRKSPLKEVTKKLVDRDY